MRTLSTSKIYKLSAFLSYIIGYIYLKYVMWTSEFGSYKQKAWVLVFSILFIAWTEGFAYLLGNTYQKLKEQGKSVVEPVIFIVCILLQSVSICFWGLHDDWELYQVAIWHFTIIYYVISRMGILAAGRSGIFFLVDCLSGVVVIPITNILLRVQKLFYREYKEPKTETTHKKIGKNDIGIIITSVVVALFVCGFAISQLVSVSQTFAGIGDGFCEAVDSLLSLISFDFFFEDFLGYFIFSIPVGCWLFGLVAGSMQKEHPLSSDKELENTTREYHSLPSYSAYIIIGSVCVLYGIFFISAFIDLLNGNIATTAHEASEYAVGSFWQLIRVVVLNLVIMFASCFFSKKALWVEKGTRILATILFVFAIAFAVFAALNLIVYIGGYGFTPRRILSSWVVVNIITWCVLILIRLNKKIPAAQIGILFAAVSFSAVVCGCF